MSKAASQIQRGIWKSSSFFFA